MIIPEQTFVFFLFCKYNLKFILALQMHDTFELIKKSKLPYCTNRYDGNSTFFIVCNCESFPRLLRNYPGHEMRFVKIYAKIKRKTV